MMRCKIGVVGLVGLCMLAILASRAQTHEPLAGGRVNVWVGTENLPGYGRLEFRFDGAKVVMIDARETCEGTCTGSNGTWTMTFPGRAVYSGTINGNTMSGTGRDDTRTWTFKLHYQGQQ